MSNNYNYQQRLKKAKDLEGAIYDTKLGGEVEIVEYISCTKVKYKFIGYNDIYLATYPAIINGNLRNKMSTSVCGVGYLGIGAHKTKIGEVHSNSYEVWRGMLRRCYDKKYKEKHPSYDGCSVADAWHNYQVFANWYEEQKSNGHLHEGWELDKDILKKGNKIYSTDTCCFIPNEVNSCLVLRGNDRGKSSLGVRKYKTGFMARVMQNSAGTGRIAKNFKTEREAFLWYSQEKERVLHYLANKWQSLLRKDAYEALVNFKITDDL